MHDNVLALAWVAAISGLTAKTVDGASVIAYPIHFLPLFSSAFVPTETMPGPLRAFAENQPRDSGGGDCARYSAMGQ